MRNLKRALSLGLTAAMISGLMVMGSSAASYADVTSENNVEAIEVLEAVGIMIGDENGNFNPDQNVTRNEMAVIMANLMEYNVATYKDTSPFTDVPSWAEPYVAACWTNGITAGYSDTIYGGSDTVTTAQAALMLMKALGYFQYASDFGGDWQLATTRQGNAIDLFVGVDSSVTAPMTRNDVAQLVLNTLESGTVQANTSGSITVGGVTIATDVQYDYITSNQSYASAIDDARTTNIDGDLIQGSVVELGEQLYMGDLQLEDNTIDDFGRPSRTWSYDGDEIGTYAKKELLRQTYTVGVEGGEVYNDIGAAACDYDLTYWVDGVEYTDAETAAEAAKLERRNDDDLGETGRGVLTEVYVDINEEETTIVEVHTYLAQAVNDYSESTGRLTATVYTGRTAAGNLITESKRLEVDDFPQIADYQEDDFLMVTMADGDVKSVDTPEVVSGVSVTSYSSDGSDGTVETEDRLTRVTANGTEYNISEEAYYDEEYLFDYNVDRQQMYEFTYDLLLDSYGYLLGIENVTDNNNYFFVVGYEYGSTHLAKAVDQALVIFPDGTMETVDAQERDGVTVPDSGVVNAWYTYSQNANGVYEIRGLANRQFADTLAAGAEIDYRNDTLATNVDVAPNPATYDHVYGNDESVYITVDIDNDVVNVGGVNIDSIVDVDSVITGIGTANIEMFDPQTTIWAGGYNNYRGNVFGLYDENGYVTHAIVLGDTGAHDFVYLTSTIKESNLFNTSEYEYGYDAITSDSTEITRVYTDDLTVDSNTNPLRPHNLYEATYDADGRITRMVWMGDSTTFNTDEYESEGYGQMTLNTANGVQEFLEAGSTIRFPTEAHNDNYVRIDSETQFYVNGADDDNGEYEEYGNMNAALTALGTNAAGQHLLTASSTAGTNKQPSARFVVLADPNTGIADIVIFYDRVYEEITTPGNPNVPAGSFAPVTPNPADWTQYVLRYYEDRLTTAQAERALETYFGEGVTVIAEGLFRLDSMPMIPMTYTQQEVVAVSVDGDVAGYMDAGVSDTLDIKGLPANTYYIDSARTDTAPYDTSNASGVLSISTTLNADLELTTAYQVKLNSLGSRALADGTAAEMYVAEGETVVITITAAGNYTLNVGGQERNYTDVAAGEEITVSNLSGNVELTAMAANYLTEDQLQDAVDTVLESVSTSGTGIDSITVSGNEIAVVISNSVTDISDSTQIAGTGLMTAAADLIAQGNTISVQVGSSSPVEIDPNNGSAVKDFLLSLLASDMSGDDAATITVTVTNTLSGAVVTGTVEVTQAGA